MSFDIERFKETLLSELGEVIPRILSDLSSEGIYSISIYTSGNTWDYIFPTVSTFKGLDEVAEKYKAIEHYSHQSLDELRRDLKWSPCDSPRHTQYVSALPGSEALLRPIYDIMQELYDEEADDWGRSEELHEKLVASCMEVLRALDKDNLFSGKVDRNSVIINLLNGDQSNEERLERAKLLNPESVYLRYRQELET